MGATTSFAPASATSSTSSRFEHRAGADQNLVAEQSRNEFDARQGIGRIERHFDRAETRLDNDRGDRIGFVRRDAAQDGDERGRSKRQASQETSVAGDAKKPARRGARRRGASGNAERLERGEIAPDQRLCARDMRLLAGKEPARLADLRADQEAGEIFASVVLRRARP